MPYPGVSVFLTLRAVDLNRTAHRAGKAALQCFCGLADRRRHSFAFFWLAAALCFSWVLYWDLVYAYECKGQ